MCFTALPRVFVVVCALPPWFPMASHGLSRLCLTNRRCHVCCHDDSILPRHGFAWFRCKFTMVSTMVSKWFQNGFAWLHGFTRVSTNGFVGFKHGFAMVSKWFRMVAWFQDGIDKWFRRCFIICICIYGYRYICVYAYMCICLYACTAKPFAEPVWCHRESTMVSSHAFAVVSKYIFVHLYIDL